MTNPVTGCNFCSRSAEKKKGGGLQKLSSLCFIYVRCVGSLPDTHLLFSPDFITRAEAMLPHPDTDMNIIWLMDWSISVGAGLLAALINYQSLHYALDYRRKFSAEKFRGAGGQSIQFEARENMDEQKTKSPGRRNEIMSCVPNHMPLF